MKRIVLCADGTWNEPEQKDEKTGRIRPTNVLKVARAVKPEAHDGKEQIVFYLPGIGGESEGVDKLTDGAFGHGMERNVRTLYRFLAYNYVEGDEIYLFGFSRGAFTVRSLVGFMNLVGRLEKSDEFYTPSLFSLYETGKRPGSREWTQAYAKVRNPRPCPPILFIGVWDTVGSRGAPGLLGQFLHPGKYKFHDTSLNPHVQHAYHALAVDERRGPFAPTLFERPAGWNGMLEQAWFPGYHCNVGGSLDPDGVANEALHWIVEKAEALGLELDAKYLGFYLPCFNSDLRDSMSFKYRLIKKHVRPVGANGAHGERLHKSVLDRMGHAPSAYAPENVSPNVPGRMMVVDTQRLLRGKPCAPLPSRPDPDAEPISQPNL
jgi:uncharacterized protein (DUF2235 family)